MGKISQRRRLAVTTSAAILFPNSPLAIAVTAAATTAAPMLNTMAPVRASTASTTSVGAPLSTVFSCGTRWTTARTCSTLCPTGDDGVCPPGQHCYGGTSCSGEALERQRRLERREVHRLARMRDEEYAPRFVCGRSFAAAEASCGFAAPDLERATPHYCATGYSAQCPADTECYAAVPCPRSTQDEEPRLLSVEEGGLWRNSFWVTEPVLMNSTDTVAMKEEELSEDEEMVWSLFTSEFTSAILELASGTPLPWTV